MNVEFCECGGMLVPSKGGVKCRSCGRSFKKTIKKIKTPQKKKDIVIIEDNRPDLPETDNECPKCSNNRAYWWMIQTRSSDEPPTRFYKCTKCKHTWREYT